MHFSFCAVLLTLLTPTVLGNVVGGVVSQRPLVKQTFERGWTNRGNVVERKFVSPSLKSSVTQQPMNVLARQPTQQISSMKQIQPDFSHPEKNRTPLSLTPSNSFITESIPRLGSKPFLSNTSKTLQGISSLSMNPSTNEGESAKESTDVSPSQRIGKSIARHESEFSNKMKNFHFNVLKAENDENEMDRLNLVQIPLHLTKDSKASKALNEERFEEWLDDQLDSNTEPMDEYKAPYKIPVHLVDFETPSIKVKTGFLRRIKNGLKRIFPKLRRNKRN